MFFYSRFKFQMLDGPPCTRIQETSKEKRNIRDLGMKCREDTEKP